jgi:hypothetical protein
MPKIKGTKVDGVEVVRPLGEVTGQPGAASAIKIRLPTGEHAVHPHVLAHIRVLEKAIETKEAHLQSALREIALRPHPSIKSLE